MTQVCTTHHARGSIIVCGFEKMVTVGLRDLDDRKHTHITIYPDLAGDGLNSVQVGFYNRWNPKELPQVVTHHGKTDQWVDYYVASYMQDVK